MGKKKTTAAGSEPTAAQTAKGLEHLDGLERYYMAPSKKELVPHIVQALKMLKKHEDDPRFGDWIEEVNVLAEQFDKTKQQNFTACMDAAGRIISILNACEQMSN